LIELEKAGLWAGFFGLILPILATQQIAEIMFKKSTNP
jgi:hypothetical protein